MLLAGGVMAIHCDVVGCPGGGEPDARRGIGARVHLDVPPFCARRVKKHRRTARDTSTIVAATLLVALVLGVLIAGWFALA